MTKSSDRFVADLIASRLPVYFVAAYLMDQEKRVEVQPMVIRPDFASRLEYSDGGDLLVDVGGSMKVVEVKQLGATFSGPEDWPFKDVIANEAYRVTDEAMSKTVAFANLSKDFRCILWLLTSTRDRWTKRSKFDKAARDIRQFFVAPKDCAVFSPIGLEDSIRYRQWAKEKVESEPRLEA